MISFGHSTLQAWATQRDDRLYCLFHLHVAESSAVFSKIKSCQASERVLLILGIRNVLAFFQCMTTLIISLEMFRRLKYFHSTDFDYSGKLTQLRWTSSKKLQGIIRFSRTIQNPNYGQHHSHKLLDVGKWMVFRILGTWSQTGANQIAGYPPRAPCFQCIINHCAEQLWDKSWSLVALPCPRRSRTHLRLVSWLVTRICGTAKYTCTHVLNHRNCSRLLLRCDYS